MADNSTPEQKRKPGRPFAKGKSGNPGGRPKAMREVVETARKHTVTAINALARIAKDPKQDPKARVAAATTILDRGWGKPVVAISGPNGGPIELAAMPTPEVERRVIELLAAEGKVLLPHSNNKQ